MALPRSNTNFCDNDPDLDDEIVQLLVNDVTDDYDSSDGEGRPDFKMHSPVRYLESSAQTTMIFLLM